MQLKDIAKLNKALSVASRLFAMFAMIIAGDSFNNCYTVHYVNLCDMIFPKMFVRKRADAQAC